MTKLFMMIMTLQNTSGGYDTWAIDLNMNQSDCSDMVLDYDTSDNPMIEFECVEQLTGGTK